MEDYRLLEVENLKLCYHTGEGDIQAVDNLSFHLRKGETLGIIGESKCGKTTLVNALINIPLPSAEIVAGEIRINGRNIVTLPEADLRKTIRWVKIAMVPKDESGFFTPVYSIKKVMSETLKEHLAEKKEQSGNLIIRSLARVGLPPETVNKYPYELSKSIKRRVVIATALLLDPEVVVFDEPTTLLDPIAQIQIINLLKELKKALTVSYLFVTQDLSAAAEIADRVLVMYAGKVVESCTNEQFYDYENKHHPYSLGLLKATPRLRVKADSPSFIPGIPPDLLNPPSGCRFHPRCDRAVDRCVKEEPPLIEAEPEHLVACWRLIPEE
jgi:peptide/nickel transport system ATP-binding protein